MYISISKCVSDTIFNAKSKIKRGVTMTKLFTLSLIAGFGLLFGCLISQLGIGLGLILSVSIFLIVIGVIGIIKER